MLAVPGFDRRGTVPSIGQLRMPKVPAPVITAGIVDTTLPTMLAMTGPVAEGTYSPELD
ncbi:MAG TPA: hypothetical protein VNG12_01115 [Acidimicrobiales bacterium]|nr:hypothetical protein [Acidimicrobiales bacterium]